MLCNPSAAAAAGILCGITVMTVVKNPLRRAAVNARRMTAVRLSAAASGGDAKCAKGDADFGKQKNNA